MPNAGYIDENRNVILHNGVGSHSWEMAHIMEGSREILIINRGVHEPLEEFCFSRTFEASQRQKYYTHTMLELGAYWGHYSLWFGKELKKTN